MTPHNFGSLVGQLVDIICTQNIMPLVACSYPQHYHCLWETYCNLCQTISTANGVLGTNIPVLSVYSNLKRHMIIIVVYVALLHC